MARVESSDVAAGSATVDAISTAVSAVEVIDVDAISDEEVEETVVGATAGI